jgi:hypothetical protein
VKEIQVQPLRGTAEFSVGISRSDTDTVVVLRAETKDSSHLITLNVFSSINSGQKTLQYQPAASGVVKFIDRKNIRIDKPCCLPETFEVFGAKWI